MLKILYHGGHEEKHKNPVKTAHSSMYFRDKILLRNNLAVPARPAEIADNALLFFALFGI